MENTTIFPPKCYRLPPFSIIPLPFHVHTLCMVILNFPAEYWEFYVDFGSRFLTGAQVQLGLSHGLDFVLLIEFGEPLYNEMIGFYCRFLVITAL